MIHYILTDIEGTTSAISFVKDTLFPYFLIHFEDYAENNAETISEILVSVEASVLQETGREIEKEEAIRTIINWAHTDRKHTALKTLQGLVWRKGYESGEIHGHVYNDVPPVLKLWKENNIGMGVYSSGSVEAQKLLFKHTLFGDLTPHFTHYFDTNMGGKRETAAYKNIQTQLHIPANHILFLSDVEAELDAAQRVGFKTIQLVREGTFAGKNHMTASDFNDVQDIIGGI